MNTEPTAAADWVIILPVVMPLLGAGLLVMMRSARDFTAAFALLLAAATIYADFELLRRVLVDGPLSMTMGGWLPPFGISFTADIMGAGFALVGAVTTFVVLVFVQGTRREPDNKDGYYALVLMLLAGANGAFLTGDLFNLYVWFEVMLIASFGLMVIGGRPVQLDATVKYGILNFLGTTLFLLGLGLLYGATGTLNMADIALAAPQADRAVMTAIGALFLLAFGIKAAAFPVNAWLPASYHAPPPATSALLAGLATKVGVYALLRVLLALLPAARDFLEPVLVAVAAATLLLAPLGAIAETNLRRALGFFVIGGIGTTLAGLALGSAGGAAGSIVYVVHAILTLTALYLVAGLLEALTGETDTRRMGGLIASQPLIAALFLVLVFSTAGVPPFLGFWPKLMVLQAALDPAGGTGEPGAGALLLAACLLLNALLTLIAGTRIWSTIFWRPADAAAAPDEASGTPARRPGRRERGFGLAATAGLAALVVAAGLWPEPIVNAGRISGIDLVDPERYIRAVPLGGAP